jgi:hypothetical protein
VERFGADDSFPITDIDEILPGLLEEPRAGVLHHGREPDFDTRVINWVREIRKERCAAACMRPTSSWLLDHPGSRHAPVQEPRRDQADAHGGQDRRPPTSAPCRPAGRA